MTVRIPVGLVVPVYDEVEQVEEFVPALVDFVASLHPGSELIVVDDGSADGTADRVHGLLEGQPGARILRRAHQGKGAAVAAGIKVADAPLIAYCDLDLSTPLADLARICAAADRAPVLAVGSRDLAGSTILRPEGHVREALGRVYNRLIQAAVAPGVVDTQCGAKAASADVWRTLLLHAREQGFAWDAEIIGLAMALGIEVQEVPIEWRHDDRSKVRLLRDGVRMVAATPRIWRRTRRVRTVRRRSVQPRGRGLRRHQRRALGWVRSHPLVVPEQSGVRRNRAPAH